MPPQPENPELAELKAQLQELQQQAQRSEQQRGVMRAALVLLVFAAVVFPNRVPDWATDALRLLCSGTAVLTLVGNRPEVLELLGKKLG